MKRCCNLRSGGEWLNEHSTNDKGTCQSNRCGSNRYQYERFDAKRKAMRPWIVAALGRSEDALASRRMIGPAEGQDEMAGGNATHT